jgi:signal transduction histidine kinase
MAHLTSRQSLVLIALVAAALGSAEWLRSPGPLPAAVTLVASATAVTVVIRVRLGRLLGWLAVVAAGQAVLLGTLEYRRLRFVFQWEGAGRAVEADIARAVRERLDRAAGSAASIALATVALDTTQHQEGFESLERLLPADGSVRGVALVIPGGRPVLWAGRPLIPVTPSRDTLVLTRSAFSADLEVSRHRADGMTARVTVPLAAAPAQPMGGVPILAAIEARFGVAMAVLPAADSNAAIRWPESNPVLGVRITGLAPATAVGRLRAVAAPLLGAGMVLLLLGVAAVAPPLLPRLAILGLVPFAALRARLEDSPALAPFFSPAVYFSPVAGPFSASAGALLLTGCFGFLAAVALWHRSPRRRMAFRVVGLVLVGASPYVLREFGRGITPPAEGVSLSLWFVWHLALLLPAAAMLVAGSALLRDGPPARRPWLSALALPLAIGASLAGILVFTGRPAWPAWYTLVWVPPLLLAARPTTRLVTMIVVGAVAGAGAGLMTWGGAVAGRTDLALRDIASLGPQTDPLAEPLLVEFGTAAAVADVAGSGDLYRLWSTSALRRQGYPSRLSLWSGDSLRADLRLDLLALPDSLLGAIARETGPGRSSRIEAVGAAPGVHSVLALRTSDSLVLTVAVGPRSRLIAPSPLRWLVAPAAERLPPYRLALAPLPGETVEGVRGRWRREGWALRVARPVTIAGERWEAGVFIPIGRPTGLVVRGGLLLLLDMALVTILWLAAERMVGVPVRRWRWQDVLRSYQGRLAIALGAFAVLPAATLTSLTLRQLAGESLQSRDLVLQRILRDAAPPVANGVLARTPTTILAEASERVDAGLALYVDGALAGVSDPLLAQLGIFPALLDPSVYHSLHLDGDLTAAPANGPAPSRLGYATIGTRDRSPVVLAAAVPANDAALRERQADVAFLLLLLTLLSVFAALALARAAARTLSRPVEDLRSAALAFGRGGAAPDFAPKPPVEFSPVFDAFHRMASDVRTGQSALESAQRRTERVLATVSTGVVALDAAGRVTLANRHALDALGSALTPGTGLAGLAPAWAPLAEAATRVLCEGGDAELELDVAGRRMAARLGALEIPEGGAVIALTDITEATRAARVLAWADVANQVAHAIKNPLTPLRLGVQHLQRVGAERPEDLARILPDTAARILSEIDRLDGIARAFSRFAAPASGGEPLEEVDGEEVLREAAALYHMAPGMAVEVEAVPGVRLRVRREELVEVLANLLDNARNAGARTVTLRLREGCLEVADDGRGVSPEHLERIFEPRFSTTSSGAGLGLAVVRRLVESWGATVSVASTPGAGATFQLRFPETAANVSDATA